MRADPTGILGAVVVVTGCSALSLLLWSPLAWPAGRIRGAVPSASCGGVSPDLLKQFCELQTVATPLFAPLALLVVAFLFRKALGAAVKAARQRLPSTVGFLFAPAFATVVFALSWAGGHADRPMERGLLPQVVFPGLVGLTTYAIAQWGPLLHRVLRLIFDLRDRTPKKLRILMVMAVPAAASMWLATGSRAPSYNEQLVVLVGLVTGFLVIAPRQTREEPRHDA